MKTAGLSSKVRTAQRHNTKAKTFANAQVGFLAAKEKQRSLLLQAEKAQQDRREREKRLLAAIASKSKE
ncbi:MAG: hypothetical protein JST80_13150 [Bdellovibrionales bacterium]|nr:hypothetical protein [Bdellovibrionales bacterium]